jgi:hypothetical protein
LEFAWIELVEFLENSLFKQFRMESSDSVNGVRANDTEIGHPDFLGVAFFDERQPLDLSRIAWILLLEFRQIDVVDQIDDLHVSWKKIRHEIY